MKKWDWMGGVKSIYDYRKKSTYVQSALLSFSTVPLLLPAGPQYSIESRWRIKYLHFLVEKVRTKENIITSINTCNNEENARKSHKMKIFFAVWTQQHWLLKSDATTTIFKRVALSCLQQRRRREVRRRKKNLSSFLFEVTKYILRGSGKYSIQFIPKIYKPLRSNHKFFLRGTHNTHTNRHHPRKLLFLSGESKKIQVWNSERPTYLVCNWWIGTDKAISNS